MKFKTLFILILIAGLSFAAGKWGGALIPRLKQKAVAMKSEVSIPVPTKSVSYDVFRFDSPKTLKTWKLRDVQAELSQNEIGSVHLKYGTQEKAPAFYIEEGLGGRNGDWSQYGVMSFEITNLTESPQHLTLQVKDAGGSRYKEELEIGANAKEKIDVSVDALRASLDVRKVRQFNLFRWDPKQPAEFLLSSFAFQSQQKYEEQFEQEESVSEDQIPVNWWAEQFKQHYQQYWEQYDPQMDAQIVRVPLNVIDETRVVRRSWPLTGGVPLPQGAVKSLDQLRVTDLQHQEVPRQFRSLATWADGSIKWVQVDLQADVTPNYHPTFFLEFRQEPFLPLDDTSRLVLNDTPERVQITTGPMRLEVSKQQATFLDAVWLDANGDQTFSDEERVVLPSDMTVDFRGESYAASLDKDSFTVTVEENGPLKTTLKMTGWYVNEQGNRFCQYVMRLQAFTGQSFVRLYHTLIYTGYPENKHHFIFEDLEMPENETIESFGLDLNLNLEGKQAYHTADNYGLVFEPLVQDVALIQKNPEELVLYDGVELTRETRQTEGWLDVADERHGVSVYVRESWQQAPKGWRVTKVEGQAPQLSLDLWPKLAGELDLKTEAEAYGPGAVARGSAFGLAKTHEVYLYFHPTAVHGAYLQQVAEAFDQSPVLLADTGWITKTGAMGYLVSKDENAMIFDAEVLLGNLFDWALRQPTNFNWYGMLDYGDTRLWYRRDAYDKSYTEWGWHPEGRWGWFNNEGVGLHTGLLLQFVRTGDIDYFRFADRNTKHVMDVDTVHYNTVANDKRLKKLISDDFSQVGSMHRHNANHWGGRNEETSHTHLLGFLYHYYLTGYTRSMDVAHEVGEFLLKDKVTYYKHPDIAPQRSVANALWGTIDMYAATHEEKYKEAADRWARVLVRGQKMDGSWTESYNPVKKVWFGGPKPRFVALYTVPALIAYHQQTGSPSVARSIVRAVDYLIKKERFLPYFDGLAYAYRLTGKDRYLGKARELLSFQIQSQQGSGTGALGGGMVFQKQIYDRVPPLLFSVPYGIGGFVDDWVFPQPEPEPEPAVVPEAAKPSHSSIREAGSLKAGVAVSLQRVFPKVKELPVLQNQIELALAQNEAESVQLVLWSEESSQVVEVDWTDFQQLEGSAILAKEQLQVELVNYVRTKKPGYEVERVGEWPDPLTPIEESISLEKNRVQPLWLTLKTPADAVAGEYQGNITIKTQDGHAITMPIKVLVWDFTLPTKPNFATAFDFYPNRLEQAYERDFPQIAKQWQGRWKALEAQYFDTLLEYKISPMVHMNPDVPQDIAQIRNYQAAGLTDFSIGLLGGHRGNNWPEDPLELHALSAEYRRYAHTLREAGLLESSYVYTYDEPQSLDARVLSIARMIREADPELRNLIVLQDPVDVDASREWFEAMDIVCFRNVALQQDAVDQLKSMGKTVWIYVSGPRPPYPTFVIDYPALAYRIMPWMSWQHNVEGLLYWTTNFWRTNPWTDPMNTKWKQNGNGVLLYPSENGPVASLRMALIRDGVEDYDYLSILRDTLDSVESTANSKLVKEAKALLKVPKALTADLKTYTQDPWVLMRQRQAIAQMIERLKE